MEKWKANQNALTEPDDFGIVEDYQLTFWLRDLEEEVNSLSPDLIEIKAILIKIKDYAGDRVFNEVFSQLPLKVWLQGKKLREIWKKI